MIEAVADLAQEKFRQSYRKENPTESHVKTTVDKAWIKQHGTDQVDMTIDYSQLPSDWQAERSTGAQIALDAVLAAQDSNRKLDESFVEETADLLHIKWLERNTSRATEIHKLPYAELPEYQKNKDRFFVHAAIEIAISDSK
jgi:hypothetical protein